MSPALRRWAPLGVVAAVAVGFALMAGMRAVPPGETEIIEAAARDYVARTGGARTDCFARPSLLEGVRLVVVCDDGAEAAWARAYDRWGREVTLDTEQLAREPMT